MAVGKANFGGTIRVTATDTPCYSSDGGGSGVQTTYTKVKDVDVVLGGTYRVKFDISVDAGAYTVYGRIYVNGVAVGTERSNGPGYVTYSQDIAVNKGDNIQLYVKNSTGGTVTHYYRNFRLYSNLFTTVL